MKKLLLIPLILVIAVGSTFSGCGEKGPEAGSQITIASVDFAYESTDPIFYESFWGWSMFDALVTWDVDGNYIGSVAESWELSADGKTWTFKIREDIVFHNGDKLTAHDVKFSVDRFASEESTNPWSPYLRNNLNYTEVTDDYTFVYHSNTPEPPLIIPFAWTRIIAKDYFEEVGQDAFRLHPIGSGPWKFVEWVPETSFTMEAFEDHWRQVPAYQYIVDLQVPEMATRIAMLKRGDVDIALGITNDRVVEMMAEGWRTEAFGLPGLYNISFTASWVENVPTSDIRVRKAMSYAVNRQELCDTWYMGLARPGGRWFMHEGTWGWDPSWVADPYDPALAMQLLEEAGYPDAFDTPTIKYFVSPGPGVDLALIMQAYWAEVGIDVQVEVIDAVEWGGMFFVRNTEVGAPNVGGIFPWGFGSVFDNIYHCANMFTSVGVHSTGNDPMADELYAKATGEIDPVLAKQYWTEFQNYVYDEMFINCPFVVTQPLVLVGPNLGAVTTFAHLSLADAYAGIQLPED